MPDYTLLTPKIEGPEIVEMDLAGFRFTAFSGTGFDPERQWHTGLPVGGQGPFPIGGDGLRYAIAIQQHRDVGDYASADAARDIVSGFGYDVGSSKDRTVVSGKRKRTA